MRKLNERGMPVLGICGGYQMMGERLRDPDGVERGGELAGMGLLPCETVFSQRKTRTRTRARVLVDELGGIEVAGYEIHMGQTTRTGGTPFARLADGREDGCVSGRALGTYLHGLFDEGAMVDALATWLLDLKGLAATYVQTLNHRQYQDQQINLLADEVRAALDMEAIYQAMKRFAR